MPYESNRNRNNSMNNNQQEQQQPGATQSYQDAKAEKKQGEKDASKKVAKTAAKGAATYFAGPAGGKAVDALAKTKAGDAILNKGGEALSKMPGVGKAAKKLDDKGVVDKADKAIDIAGAGSGGAGAGAGAGASAGNAAGGANAASSGGGKPPGGIGGDGASSGMNDSGMPDIAGLGPFGKKKKSQQDDNNGGEQENNISGKVTGNAMVKVIAIAVAPFFLIIFLLVAIISSVSNGFSDFEDAFGAAGASGGETGNVIFEASSPEAKEFYETINDVKLSYQASGKTVDALKIAAVYHVITSYDSEIYYDDMSRSDIEKIADAMFSGNSYSEDTFRQNLQSSIFPSYFPGRSDKTYEKMTDEVFDYIERYYSLIGYEEDSSSCASSGSCVYQIKGFYISGKGNVNKELNISNLQVRLMQTGSGNGHNYGGTFGQPLENEELVPFEKYILGVAYQEIGPDAPDEAIKAQMVAARSYILARPFDMGGWRKLEQEGDGNWVIQVAASTQDQVYCDPDQGCSSTDGQWGQVHSGLSYTGFQRQPMAQDSKLRTLASETMGEVLVNSEGYIIYAGYLQTEQNQFSNLAKQGMNYKQILLQVYNGGSRNYGASDIQKMNCNSSGSSNCTNASTGQYASWKQYEGPWIDIQIGGSGSTIRQIGCLVTSVSMLIAKSGLPTNITDFNPGTFVEYLNSHGGFVSGGNFTWNVESAVPGFKYQGQVSVAGYSKDQKMNILKGLLDQGAYVVAEVKGNTGQHWVAVDTISNNQIVMMDPGSPSTDMWAQYNWSNTSTFAYYKTA